MCHTLCRHEIRGRIDETTPIVLQEQHNRRHESFGSDGFPQVLPVGIFQLVYRLRESDIFTDN